MIYVNELALLYHYYPIPHHPPPQTLSRAFSDEFSYPLSLLRPEKRNVWQTA